MKLRILLFYLLVTTISIATSCISVDGQAVRGTTRTVTSKSANIDLRIAVPIEPVKIGQELWVSLTVRNLGKDVIPYPSQVEVHVEGRRGEPRTTLRQRQLTNRLEPGEKQIRTGGFEPPIEPGALFTRKYNLSDLYEFQEPGKYTVYVDVLEEPEPGTTRREVDRWVRSAVATFELQAPTK